MTRKIIGVIIMVALLVFGCFAVTMFYRQYADAKSSASTFEELQEQIKNTEELPSSETEGTSEPDETESTPAETEPTVFDKYRPLQEQNGDMVGWIFIEGTEVNYPVMQTPDNPDYYLKHSFEKTWSDYGVPYVDESCTVGISNNLVIYGHNMKNGSMFSGLVQYKSKEFFESHPVICFDTVDEPGQYQVIAAFRYNTNNETFKYNEHSDMDEAEFAEYVASCKSRSIYDTGVTAEYGDVLITLSTCEYTYTNGRFVVVAKKIVK